MGGLSPRANGPEYLEAADLVAGGPVEAIPQRSLDAAEFVLRQAQRLHDAGRIRAAVPGDDDDASGTDDPVQFGNPRVEVGPDRHVSHRDDAVDARVGKPGAIGGTEIEPNPPGAD